MRDVACGLHALDRLIHDECIYCLRARIAARDKQIERLRAALTAIAEDNPNQVRTPTMLATIARQALAAGGSDAQV